MRHHSGLSDCLHCSKLAKKQCEQCMIIIRSNVYSFIFNSLGIVLSRGYGQYMFTGNVSVEEGKSFVFLLVLLKHHKHFTHDFPSFSSGLHDLLTPDLTVANEW